MTISTQPLSSARFNGMCGSDAWRRAHYCECFISYRESTNDITVHLCGIVVKCELSESHITQCFFLFCSTGVAAGSSAVAMGGTVCVRASIKNSEIIEKYQR